MSHTEQVVIFFSCSFRDDDSEVNSLVQGVCNGLGMTCVNVGAGFSRVPPEQARSYIERSIGLVAVVTKRDRLDSGSYAMPPAVHEEIAIAFGIRKPILILAEEGVALDGFINNYGTHLPFVRSALSKPSFVEKLVFSLLNFRQEITADSSQQYASEFHSEFSRNLISLEFVDDQAIWTSSVTKRYRFEAPLSREIPAGFWPGVPLRVDPTAAPGEWEIKVLGGSMPFKINAIERLLAPDRIDLSLRILPDPRPGDFLEFTRIFRSRYRNPVYMEDLIDSSVPAIVVDGRGYFAHDGITTVERTQNLHVRFSFPERYDLTPNDVAVFCASHSYGIDYINQRELSRIRSEVDSFGGRLMVDVRVEDPLPRHAYGLAWVPPSRVK